MHIPLPPRSNEFSVTTRFYREIVERCLRISVTVTFERKRGNKDGHTPSVREFSVSFMARAVDDTIICPSFYEFFTRISRIGIRDYGD